MTFSQSGSGKTNASSVWDRSGSRRTGKGRDLGLTLVSVIVSVHLAAAGTWQCPRMLGLGSGQIQDWQLSASSFFVSDLQEKFLPKYGRLHQHGVKAWCAKNRNPGEWILVDLGVVSQITGVTTQGRSDSDEWVTFYTLSYSADAFKWHYVSDSQGDKRIFRANSDSSSVRYNLIDPPIEARFFKLHVMEWSSRPCLRLELVGCQECNEVITESPNVIITSSTLPKAAKRYYCQPDSAQLFSHTGWCAKKNNEHQWLQFDVGPPRLFTGIVTRGHGGWESSRHSSWVSSYTLSYSNDTFLWFYYRDGNHLDPKIFGGNMDKDTERRHYLTHPFTARYVRIHPRTWHHGIGMRGALLGCPHYGDCGQGFFRVNPISGCMENLAFQRDTWLNDKRHLWKDWKYGRASLAVDGDTDNSLHRCAILDNYFVENPIWMVDLGKKTDVRGLVLFTWQGKGQDKTTSFKEYQSNLDKLNIYVAGKPRLESSDLLSEHWCNSISRANETLFQPRIHVQCQDDLRGRYLYIKATPQASRKSRLFFAVLCEVMVY